MPGMLKSALSKAALSSLVLLACSPATLALSMRNAASTTTVLEQPADFSAATLQGLTVQQGRVVLAPGSQLGTLSGSVTRAERLRRTDSLVERPDARRK